MVSGKKKKKIVKKRDTLKNPGLNKGMFSKIKQEVFDYDYLDKLNPKEAAWLSKFNEEYIGANLNHKGKKLHTKKAQRRDCFGRNNSRNRDIYSIKRATGMLDMEEKMVQEESEYNPEDAIITLIDDNSEE